MSKRQRLTDLIERDFTHGYAGFVDVTDRQEMVSRMMGEPPAARAAMRINHLLMVAMIEGLTDAEDAHETGADEAILLLWRNVGVALAMINRQSFTRIDNIVRHEMIRAIKGGYDETAAAMGEILRAEGGAQ